MGESLEVPDYAPYFSAFLGSVGSIARTSAGGAYQISYLVFHNIDLLCDLLLLQARVTCPQYLPDTLLVGRPRRALILHVPELCRYGLLWCQRFQQAA